MYSPSTIDYQKQLIAASLDDFTPNAVFADFRGGQYGYEPEVWRSAVIDFLCYGLSHGLIEATHRPYIRGEKGAEFIRDILTRGDRTSGMDASILWDALYFNGTKKLIDIMDRYGLRSWESLNDAANHDLASELKIKINN